MSVLQEHFVDDFVVAAPVHSRLPRLDLGIDWVPGWEEFRTSLHDAFSGPKPEGSEPVSGGADLSVEWIRGYRPGNPLFAAMLFHAVAIWLITLPIWGFLPQAQSTLAPLQVDMTWYVPADLHPITLPARTARQPHAAPRATGDDSQPAQRGADAYHPRQTILSVPVKLTHPRQTLIQPNAPAKAPSIVAQMPNIVEWSAPQVQRPTIDYSTAASAPQLRQTQRRAAAAPQIANSQKNAPALDVSQPADFHLAPPAPVASNAAVAPRRIVRHDVGAAPQISSPAGSAIAPSVGQSTDLHLAPPAPLPSNSVAVTQHRAVRQEAAPEIAAQSNGNPADMRRLIALSAAPAPPSAEVRVPQGNLAANVSISPDGAKPGAPGGSDRGAAGSKSPAGANANGDELPAAISISGAGSKSAGGTARPGSITPSLNLNFKPTNSAAAAAPAIRTGPANVAALPPGAAPEKLLTGEIGTMHVSAPNATSTRGSWSLSFDQLGAGPRAANQPKDTLTGPVPIHTVDPKYPPDTMNEHITGEVVLYAIIRKDGSVDSVQIVRGLDARLDKAAADALAQWRFTPGARAGEPVDLEAVIHVPFEYRSLNY